MGRVPRGWELLQAALLALTRLAAGVVGADMDEAEELLCQAVKAVAQVALFLDAETVAEEEAEAQRREAERLKEQEAEEERKSKQEAQLNSEANAGDAVPTPAAASD